MGKLTVRKVRQRIAHVIKEAGENGVNLPALMRRIKQEFQLSNNYLVRKALLELGVLSGHSGYYLQGTVIRYDPNRMT